MNGFDLVVFMVHEWAPIPWTAHLVMCLAKRLPSNRVLCVQRPVCLSTWPVARAGRFVHWLCGKDRLHQASDNLFVFRPWILLHDHLAAKIPSVTALNRLLLGTQLRHVLRQVGFGSNRLVTWIYDPFQEWCWDLLNESLRVYDCYDQYTASSATPILRPVGELVRRERRVLSLADVVFVASDALHDKKKALSRNIHVVPNAADAQHFGKAQDGSAHVPEELAHLPGPVIGMVGNITERLDLRLLLAVAKWRADWNLVFVGGRKQPSFCGETATLLSELERVSNVHFLGAKPYDALPGYLAAFDVCLIPYLATHPFNVYCSPLKLYEYLAAGKPIVSTDLPAVRRFNGVVRIGVRPRQFIRQIEEALTADDTWVEDRLRLARDNSWHARAGQVLQILDSTLQENRH